MSHSSITGIKSRILFRENRQFRPVYTCFRPGL